MSTSRQRDRKNRKRMAGGVGWSATILAVIGLGMAIAGASGWGEAIPKAKWEHSQPLPSVEKHGIPTSPDAGSPDANNRRLVGFVVR